MSNPIVVCKLCDEPFELKPDKPGFATYCPACSAPKTNGPKDVHIANRQERLKRIEYFIRFCKQDKERAERLDSPSLAAMREKEIRMLTQMKVALEARIGTTWDY